MIDRRRVIGAGAAVAFANPLRALADIDDVPCARPKPTQDTTEKTPMAWPVSLAQWSLHRALRAGELAPEDFPAYTRDTFDIGGVEYVNTFFQDKATDDAWLSALARRARDAQVTNVLIMIDAEGALGDPDDAGRAAAVENHHRWLHAAKAIGCHGIRVNVPSQGTPEEQRDLCARGLSALLKHADALEMNVMIENHGGLSSNGAWLAALVTLVDHPRLGTLPDFGNFVLDWDTKEMYDRYKGIDELLPHAKALSAKSHDFDDAGDERHTDYGRMFELVRKHGYEGWVGVEYEGDEHSENDGITRTRDLLVRHGCTLT